MADARVVGLARREKPRAEMEEVPEFDISVTGGIGIDRRSHLSPPERQVTVLFGPQWRAACAEVGQSLPWKVRRANILVEDLENPRQAGIRFQLGSVELEVTGECAPCERMEEVQTGLRAALESDWRGGVTCRVIRDGRVAVGDAASRMDPAG